MGKYARYSIILLLFVCSAVSNQDVLAGDDFGMSYAVGIEKKFSKKTKLEAEAELRNRNNTRTIDRFSLSASVHMLMLEQNR